VGITILCKDLAKSCNTSAAPIQTYTIVQTIAPGIVQTIVQVSTYAIVQTIVQAQSNIPSR
jgi:hypothetical protein